jgi:hypothetical protein
MKNQVSPPAGPKAQFLKILGSGEIVRCKQFSEITQLYEVESPDGRVFTVQSNKVSQQVTPEEAAEFTQR